MNETSNNVEEQGASVNRIQELSRAFQASRILLTAYELGVFSVLGEEDKTSADVALAIQADQRATDRLLNALCALELLAKSGDKYANTPLAEKYLVKGKADYLAGLMHTVHLWDSWSTLTEAVRKGGTVRKRPVFEEDAKWLKAFIAAMHGRAVDEAPYIVGKIDLTGVSHVLDVGGGSGAFSMAFVRASDDLQATVFDLPSVVPLTRKYIEQAGLAERIGVIPGDYNENELGSGFDLAFLSAIIHANSFAQNQELVHKVGRSLKPGGRIVISDFIMEDNRFEPLIGAVFALNMLTGTSGGDTYTESEVKRWLGQAGFFFNERIDLGRGRSLMIGTKK